MACAESKSRLGLSRPLDLYLVHWPGLWGDGADDSALCRQYRLDTWQGMRQAQEQGLCTNIGVSNFLQHHLEQLFDEFGEAARGASHDATLPAVNQLECNPLQHPIDLIKYCRSQQMDVMGYCPLGKVHALRNPTVQAIASELSSSSAQVQSHLAETCRSLSLITEPPSIGATGLVPRIGIHHDSQVHEPRSRAQQLGGSVTGSPPHSGSNGAAERAAL